MKGKGCNIAAGIFDILLSICCLAMVFLMLLLGELFVGVFEALEEAAGSPEIGSSIAAMFVYIIGVIFGVLFVVYLAFGITTLVKSGKPENEYFRARGTMLGISIVETIMFAALIYFAVVGMSFLAFALLGLGVLSLILHWVGYGLNKRPEPEPVVRTVQVDAIEE